MQSAITIRSLRARLDVERFVVADKHAVAPSGDADAHFAASSFEHWKVLLQPSYHLQIIAGSKQPGR
jgi:hypothetical protein